MARMRAVDAAVLVLEKEGVHQAFGVPGAAINPLYSALRKSGHIAHVLARHVEAASHMAEGYTRTAPGHIGVCIGTSGPAGTDMITGLYSAIADSIPILCITGQAPRARLYKEDFQAVDIESIAKPVCKWAVTVREPALVPQVFQQAFHVMRSGRPGPVLIDLPKVVQMSDASHLPDHVPASVDPVPAPEDAKLADALAAIAGAEKPVIYGGGGIGIADAVDEFRRFVETTGIPTVLTLRGLGALPANHPQLLGMLGMHGSRAANIAVQESDLLVVVGARFDDRATGKLAEFAPFARVVHLDADAYEISKLRTADIALPGDIAVGLGELAAAALDQPGNPAQHDWRQRCARNRQRHAARYDAPGQDIYAPALLRRLGELAPDAIVCSDVGQHQMWVAQHCRFAHPRNHLTSGALGTMGFGLPAAMGAQFACPDRTVVLVNGDGGFMMNVQELVTIARCRLPIKMVLLDNSSLGMVRQWQELFFDKRYSEIDLSDNPDFAALAQVCGIPASMIEHRDQVEGALAGLLASPGPALLHVKIDARANVWPLVPPNTANSQMLESNPNEKKAESAHALPA